MATKFNKHTFKSMTADGLEERNGYTFGYELADGTAIVLGAYKTDGKKPYWWVIDLDCGKGICQGATRAEAVRKAEEMRKKYSDIRETPGYAKEVAKFNELLKASKPKVTVKMMPKGTKITPAPDETAIKVTTARIIPTHEGIKTEVIDEHTEVVKNDKPKAAKPKTAKPKKPAKPKAPAKPKDETAELKARIAKLEAELAEARKPVEDASVTVSLETVLEQMHKWCKSHPNTSAYRKDGNLAPVRVAGVMRKDVEWQEELIALGFRWYGKPQVWMYDIKKAESEGKKVIDGR